MVASSNHYLLFNFWNCTFDEEKMNTPLNYKKLSKLGAHPLQFVVWRFSGKSRMVVEFFATVGIAILIHWLTS